MPHFQTLPFHNTQSGPNQGIANLQNIPFQNNPNHNIKNLHRAQNSSPNSNQLHTQQGSLTPSMEKRQQLIGHMQNLMYQKYMVELHASQN